MESYENKIRLVGADVYGKGMGERIASKAQFHLDRMSQVLRRPVEMVLHVKQINKDGSQRFNVVDGKLFSGDVQMYMSKEDWDIENAVHNVARGFWERVLKHKQAS